MVFGLSSSKSRQRWTHQRSSAIGREFSTKNPNLEARKPRMGRFDIECQGRARSPLRAAFVGPSACTECPLYLFPVCKAGITSHARSLIQNGDGTLIRKI